MRSKKEEGLKMSDIIPKKVKVKKVEADDKDKAFALSETLNCEYLKTDREKGLYYRALIGAINWGIKH